MSSQNVTQQQNLRQRNDDPQAGSLTPDQPSPLLAQSMGFGNAARKARDRVERGEAAQKSLEDRKNDSGQ